jgi:hypothetical protein
MWELKPLKKVDLAFFIDGNVEMLVECKSVKTKLNINILN